MPASESQAVDAAGRTGRPTTLPRLQIAGAAVLFSTGGAAIKACSLSNWQVAGGRSLIAAITLLILLPAARRGWSWRSGLISIVHATTMFLYVTANKLTTSANTIFLQDTAPFYVLILGPLLLRERLRLRDIPVMLAILLGLGLFFVGMEAPQATAPEPFVGNVLAALCGVTWGLTIMGLRWLARNESTATAAIPSIVMGNLLAFVLCLPFALPVETASAEDLAMVAYLGVFQVALGYLLLTRGVATVPALAAAILLMIEPIFTPVWTLILHGEVPGPWAVTGGVVILGATVTHAALTRNRKVPPRNDS
jgi:drug/metabolite transporter (DMT)-like permease